MTVLTVAQLLSGGRPDTTPVAFHGDKMITLGTLRARIAQNTARLAAIRPAQALLVCDNSVDFVVGLFSLMAAGCHTILPPNARPGTLAQFADAVDIVVSDKPLSDTGKSFVLDGAGMAASAIELKPARIEFFTSGSTGAMKRVEKSLAVLEREAAALDGMWGDELAMGDVFGTVSHQHIFGLAFCVMWPLLTGRRFAAETYFAWESLLRDLTPGAAIISSPAHLTRLGGLPVLAEARKPRLIFTAGAPLPAEAVAETATIFGAPPVEIFGSTETGAFAWHRGIAVAQQWQPLPEVETHTDDEGLLEVRSPWIGGDGVARLSDRVVFDDDGRFRFLGRADGVVKIEGKRVNIAELEQRLLGLPWIKSAVVTPLLPPQVNLGVVAILTEVGAAALAQQGKFRFVRALRRELRVTHDATVLPRVWRFVDAIPTDPMGKRRLRDIAALLEPPS